MDNIININNTTREVTLQRTSLGLCYENEYEKLIFRLDDFIDGTAVLNITKYKKNGIQKNYDIYLTKNDTDYELTVEAELLDVAKSIEMQFSVSTASGRVFKSKKFTMEVDESITSDEVLEKKYPTFLDVANSKFAMMDSKVEEVTELETELEEKESEREVAEVSRTTEESSRVTAEKAREDYITELKSEVAGGVFNGKDAKINGVSTLTLVTTDNISSTQSGSVLKIKGVTDISKFTNDIGYIDKDVDNLTNYELKSNTGSSLDLSINNTTYVMTMTLKNSVGETLSEKQVDLPIESMIINVSYNESTKTLTFTLQNGNVINVPLSDLVSGLVTTTELNTKLADYYKATEVDTKLKDYAKSTDIPTKTSELTNDSDFTTKTYVDDLVGNIDTVLETLTTGSGV